MQLRLRLRLVVAAVAEGVSSPVVSVAFLPPGSLGRKTVSAGEEKEAVVAADAAEPTWLMASADAPR